MTANNKMIESFRAKIKTIFKEEADAVAAPDVAPTDAPVVDPEAVPEVKVTLTVSLLKSLLDWVNGEEEGEEGDVAPEGTSEVAPEGEAPVTEEKWMQGAVKHPGRFTEYCKKNGFEGPCEACAAHAEKSSDASVRGMAAFYRNAAENQ